jgi:hypothetical protein
MSVLVQPNQGNKTKEGPFATMARGFLLEFFLSQFCITFKLHGLGLVWYKNIVFAQRASSVQEVD